VSEQWFLQQERPLQSSLVAQSKQNPFRPSQRFPEASPGPKPQIPGSSRQSGRQAQGRLEQSQRKPGRQGNRSLQIAVQ
jgi:hypothetical protein